MSKQPEAFALSDPLLGARMNLPGVSRWVRLRMLRNLLLAVCFLALSALLVSRMLNADLLGLASGLLSTLCAVAALLLWVAESVFRTDATIPGARAVTPR